MNEYITEGTYRNGNNMEKLIKDYLRNTNKNARDYNFKGDFYYRVTKPHTLQGILTREEQIYFLREVQKKEQLSKELKGYLLTKFSSCETSNQIEQIIDFFRKNLGTHVIEIPSDEIEKNPANYIKNIYRITSFNINAKDFQEKMLLNNRYSTQKNSSCVIETILARDFGKPKLIIKSSAKKFASGGSNTLIYPADPSENPDPNHAGHEGISILVKSKLWEIGENQIYNKLTHEALAGFSVVNEMRKYTSGAMFTYGYVNYYLNQKIEKKYNPRNQNIPIGSTLLVEYFLGKEVREIVSQKIDPTNIDEQIKFIKEFCEILFQVFSTLHSGKQWKFIHCDLHNSNVIVKHGSDEKIYPIFMNNKTYYLTSNYEAKIIDFGKCIFEISGIRFVGDVYNSIPNGLVDFCKFVGFCFYDIRAKNLNLGFDDYIDTAVGRFFEELLEIGWEKRGTSLSEMLFTKRNDVGNSFYFEPDETKLSQYQGHEKTIEYVLRLAEKYGVSFSISEEELREDTPNFRLNNIGEISTFNQIMDYQKIPNQDNKSFVNESLVKIFDKIVAEKNPSVRRVYLNILLYIFKDYQINNNKILQFFEQDYIRYFGIDRSSPKIQDIIQALREGTLIREIDSANKISLPEQIEKEFVELQEILEEL